MCRPLISLPFAALLMSIALAWGIALMAPTGASALSIAPKAAVEGKTDCTPGKECVTTQPSTPAWLTLAGGETMLTQQSLEGIAADEYGSSAEADTTLYGSVTPYTSAPAISGEVVGSTLANLDGTEEPGDTYAVVLRSDRTLEVLGPQKDGYQFAASATVPATGTLVGVVALAAPPGSSGVAEKIVVATSAGFYVYAWSSEPPTLTPESSTPSKTLEGEENSGDVGLSGDPAITCESGGLFKPNPGECSSLYTGAYKFAVPEGQRLLGVYQAPPGKGEYDGASTSFAIAYTTTTGDSYAVAVFAYEPGGHLHLIDHVGEGFPAAEEGPLEVRYATAGKFLHLATLAQSPIEATPSLEVMTQYNKIPDTGGFVYSTSGNASALCSAPEAGGLGTLAVAAVAQEPGEGGSPPDSPGLYSGASLCASLVGHQVQYRLQRSDQGGHSLVGRAEEETDVLSISKAGEFEAPAGSTIKAIDGAVDFPCDEYLSQFAVHPTPDGFPALNGKPGYCGPVTEDHGKAPYDPAVGAAGMLAAQIQYIAEDGEGAKSLREHSVSYEPEALEGTVDEMTTESKNPFSEYDELLARLPHATSSDLETLPLDPGGISWSGHLILNSSHEVLKAAGTSSPLPIAVMAAPPYYSGAEQQVSPTTTGFTTGSCNGSGSEQGNMVGAFAGVDAQWGNDSYEIEALAKVQASWTQSTEIENCQSFGQNFIAGNFGNNFVADNSLLFRVDTGKDTYLDLAKNSLGVGVTSACDSGHLSECDALFNPEGSQYALQTVSQLKHPQPNDFYATDDEQLKRQYGAALEESLPHPGDPVSYPALTTGEPSGCAGQPSGEGSGNPGIVDVNPFVAPAPAPAPNLLEAPQASEVNPASDGEEGGTSSTLAFNSAKETTSSAEFSLGAEVSAKILYAKFGAEYSHSWGTSMTQSFQSGTEFSGGVFDFNGFYNPYSYRLYECKGGLQTTPPFAGGPTATTPVFLVNYMTEQSADGLPLNFAAPSLPEGTVEQEYSGKVFASGGVPGYTYRLTGGALPPGLSFDDATGEIGGTPTEAGTFEFTVQAEDTAANRATQHDSITIAPALSVENPLAEGAVGVPYEQSLGAQGGAPPYTYLLTSSGEVPPGLGIDNTAGTLQGTPTKVGTYCFGVYIADSTFPKATLSTQTCVTIGDSPTLEPSSLPAAIEGEVYEVNVAGAGGNTGGYVYTLAMPSSCEAGYTCSSSLPAGLSLAPSGSITTIEGTPATAGKYEFAIDLNDGVGGFAKRDYTLTVEPAAAGLTGMAPAFTSAGEATVTAGSSEHLAIEASGTPAPVITLAGAIPAGMSFGDGAGGTAEISGTPGLGSTGVYTLTLTAQNGVSPTATQTFTLTVDAGPAITTQPTDQTTTAPGGTAKFTAAATGTPTPTVQWEVSADGGSSWAPMSGEASPTLSLTGLEAGENGREYRAVFTNTRGSTTSSATTDAAKLTVDHAPELVTQPSDATIDAGEDATFTAAAGGEPAPAAQWQVSSDGGVTWTNVAGATSPSMTLHGVPAVDDANEYRAAFTNAVGAITTSAAKLTVQTGPIVARQPTDQTIDAGGEATFTAAATGNPAPGVQWQVSSDRGGVWSDLSDGSGVAGATGPTLTLTGVPEGEDGNEYRAVFGNGAGGETSAAAKLTVQAGPVVSEQPADDTVDAGGEATFKAAATGKPAPGVQWQVSTDDGFTWSNVSGASSPTLTLTDLPAGDDGYEYRAVFTNAADAPGLAGVDSTAATLTVLSAPVVSEQPADDTVDAGGEATFKAAATGRPAPSVQWQLSSDGGATWSNVPGATSPTFALTNVPAGDDGYQYRAVFANAVNSVESASATLTVQTAPVVSSQPSSQTAPAGGAATFSAAASGKPTPSIQWQVSTDGGSTWTNVTGAGAPSLTLTNVPARDDGQLYRAVLTNAAGTVTSAAAELTVLSPPTVVTPPSGETVVPGGGVVFTITVSGTPAPSLQWLLSEDGGKTWTDVPGATSSALSLSHVSASENGYLYKVLIVNSQGSTTSQPVTLVVSLQAVSAATACRPAPTKLLYPRRNLGPVVRYIVYVDGHLRKTVHGRNLRSAELPKMTGAKHLVKIVSTTSRGYRLTTTRVYLDCAEVAKHVKAKRASAGSTPR
ncbi:MAG TPA: putative Ig domain-containing protein [Solirubrobacteraceae bacterium]